MDMSPGSYNTWIANQIKRFEKCKACGWEPRPGDIIPCKNIDVGPFYCPSCRSILNVTDIKRGGEMKMNNKKEKAKEFKDKILSFLKSTNKTSWGKIELQVLVKDLWIEFLEEEV